MCCHLHLLLTWHDLCVPSTRAALPALAAAADCATLCWPPPAGPHLVQDIEKLASKKGVVLQTVKEVLQVGGIGPEAGARLRLGGQQLQWAMQQHTPPCSSSCPNKKSSPISPAQH